MRRLLPGLVLFAVGLAGCGEGAGVELGDEPTPTSTTRPYAADQLVLRVVTSGGLVPQEYAFGVLPEVAVFGDGRVVVVGATTMEYPGKSYPPLLVGHIDPSRLPRLVEDAKAAGVDGEEHDYGTPGITDVGTTAFVANDSRHTYETRVYALGYDAEASGTTAAQRAGRKRLQDLRTLLVALGDGARDAFEPSGVAVYARAYQPPQERTGEPKEMAWLGPDPAGGEAFAAGHCFVVRGAHLARTLPGMRTANVLTKWLSGTKAYHLAFRPLLPGDSACVPDFS